MAGIYLVLLCCVSVVVSKAGIHSIELFTFRIFDFQSRVGHESLSTINVGKICIGTPCQWFNVMIDTGSADLWVSSSRCSGTVCSVQKNTYNRYKSYTYNPGNYDRAEIRYGSGDIQISYAKETVNFGDIKVPNQDFGESLNANKDIANAGLDGILGLAFKGLARQGKTPVFQHMVEQGLVDQPILTFCKSRDGKMKNELIIGGTNESRYDASKMAFAPLTQRLYWKFKLDGVLVNGNAATCPNGCPAVADSGTTLVRGPENYIAKLNQLIGATYYKSGQYKVNCDRKNLPNVDFVINGHTFTLTPYDYVLSLGHNTCMTGFAVTQTTMKFWILGGTFLDGLCTIYDYGNSRLGFAKLLR